MNYIYLKFVAKTNIIIGDYHLGCFDEGLLISITGCGKMASDGKADPSIVQVRSD